MVVKSLIFLNFYNIMVLDYRQTDATAMGLSKGAMFIQMSQMSTCQMNKMVNRKKNYWLIVLFSCLTIFYLQKQYKSKKLLYSHKESLILFWTKHKIKALSIWLKLFGFLARLRACPIFLFLYYFGKRWNNLVVWVSVIGICEAQKLLPRSSTRNAKITHGKIRLLKIRGDHGNHQG